MNKITESQHRIEQLYYDTCGKCYVSFSGGKDSTVVLAIVKQCQELGTVGDIPAVYCDTGIELGVTRDFVRWCRDSGWYKNIQIIRPEKSFDWVLKNKGKPLRSKLKSHCLHQWQCGSRTPKLLLLLLNNGDANGKQYNRSKIADRDMHFLHDDFPITASDECCNLLKKKPFKKYNEENGMKGNLQGIRMAEGGVRSINVLMCDTPCTVIKGDGFIQKYPLIDWTDEDLKDFIKKYDVPLSKAYTEYRLERTGCMGCPFAKNVTASLEYLYEHEPQRYKASMHWLKDVYIAQNVQIQFDNSYEREREREWQVIFEPMRQEMLRKYRPDSRLIKHIEEMKLF